MGFLSFSLCFRNISQKPQIHYFLCFPLLRVSPYFSFHSLFFSFHSFKHWRTFNTHMNQPVKLLSPPVLVDSTRFSLNAITEVSRKPKHTHFNSWFQNIHFLCAIFSRSNFGAVAGMGTVWFHVFLNFSSLFLVCRSNSLALQKSTLAFMWLGKFLYIIIFCC